MGHMGGMARGRHFVGITFAALVLFPSAASAATATTCPTGGGAQVLGTQFTAGSSNAGGATLPFTGYSPHLLELGIVLLAVGTLGRALVLRGRSGARRRTGPALRGTAVLLLVAALGVGLAHPSRAWADTCSPSSVSPVVTDPPAIQTPPAVVPEVPLAVLLPLTGAGMVVLVMRRQRRRPVPRR